MREGLRQLSNQNYYRRLDSDPTDEHNRMVTSNLDNMHLRGEITERVARYLVTEEPRTPQLYLLPKFHKNINPVPGRPIVSANESPTERISAFVDHFLSPIVQTGCSYIWDMGDFLRAWYRYINDIFCIWQYGEDELERFTSHLNSVHSTIKFTIEKSRTVVNFLDTTVSLENNR